MNNYFYFFGLVIIIIVDIIFIHKMMIIARKRLHMAKLFYDIIHFFRFKFDSIDFLVICLFIAVVNEKNNKNKQTKPNNKKHTFLRFLA